MLSRLGSRQVRQSSSLAEKLRQAGSGDSSDSRTATQREAAATTDESGEPFRELFVMPKRKLRGQIQIEQATGRAKAIVRSRTDLHDRISYRSDRTREMKTDQDWSTVWPAARTFNASVVPLPVRMGTRPDPEKRAPFKKHGNLELVKIPNFLHLTPAAIEKHCEAIKKFCTEYPAELKKDKTLLDEEFPVSVAYNTYVHQGTNIRDNRSRVITMKMKLSSLNLDTHARDKIIRLAGGKYNEKLDEITIVTDRCHTRKQNLDYANYLLTVLYHESKKVEPWEELKIRQDSLKLKFEGSKCQEELLATVQKALENSSLSPSVDGSGDLASHPKIKEFGAMWNQYKNTEETPESAREYGRRMKELLGIRSRQPTAAQ